MVQVDHEEGRADDQAIAAALDDAGIDPAIVMQLKRQVADTADDRFMPR